MKLDFYGINGLRLGLSWNFPFRVGYSYGIELGGVVYHIGSYDVDIAVYQFPFDRFPVLTHQGQGE